MIRIKVVATELRPDGKEVILKEIAEAELRSRFLSILQAYNAQWKKQHIFRLKPSSKDRMRMARDSFAETMKTAKKIVRLRTKV